jgi:hypothetical protein
MKLNNVLRVAVIILAGAFVAQLAVRLHEKPKATHFASWKHSPNSLHEAKKLASHIVSGTVTHVEAGSPLVVQIPKEPGGVDTVPIEVATISVAEVHKGAPVRQVMVFRTGSDTAAGSAVNRQPPAGPAPPKPPGGVDRPAQLPVATEAQGHTILLEDDPPYHPGDKVHLLLEAGPQVQVRGATVGTLRPVSPEGRFHVGADNKIMPASKKQAFQQLRGVHTDQFKGMLK